MAATWARNQCTVCLSEHERREIQACCEQLLACTVHKSSHSSGQTVFERIDLALLSNTQTLSEHTCLFTGTRFNQPIRAFTPYSLPVLNIYIYIPRVNMNSPSRLSSTQGPVHFYNVPWWLCTCGAAPFNQQCDSNRSVHGVQQ